MPDGFEVVKKRRNRKQNKKFDDVNIEEKAEKFHKKFEKILQDFDSSLLSFELLQTISNSLSFIKRQAFDEILCYGIGNFSEQKSSLHQLAALVKLRKQFKATTTVYDPIFTEFEVDFLKDLGFTVASVNEEGKRRVTGCTLVFLPHCPKQLTNNFLWANWSTSLSTAVVIANSFSKVIQDNTKKNLEKSANYILKIQQKTTEVPIEDTYPIENIFNDTSIHYFKPEDLTEEFFTETLESEPEYSEDTEFITNKLNNINIKNE